MKGKEKRKKPDGIDSFESFELLGVPVVIINGDLDVLFVNYSACDLFGYSSKSLYRKNISRILEDIETLGEENLLALAVRVGKTRLIDNCLLRKI